jgi:hypothetical protein
LPTMGCAAAPNPATGLSLKQRMHRFYCRCAADRGQATLLRPSGRSATAARSNKIGAPGFCAKRVGVRLADDGLRTGPDICCLTQSLRGRVRSHLDLRRSRNPGLKQNLWERTCPRRGRYIQQICCLTQSLRGRVRSRLLRGARRSPACRRWAAQRPRTRRLG